ncbi:MAG: glucose-6-phosphate isomerase [Pirellulales bacterium]
MKPIKYDAAGVLIPETGLSQDDLQLLAPQLEAARREFLDVDLALYASGDAVPDAKQPLDAGFFEMPEKLLSEYEADSEGSELGRILKTAKRLQESVDRVVLLGIGGSYMGACALFEGCCHSYHNELSRKQRNGIPRIYFEGNNVDNDATQELLDLLGDDDDWGIVVISKSGGTLETAVGFRTFLDALSKAMGGDKRKIAERVVPVCGSAGKLFDLQAALGCPESYEVPDGVGGRFSILSAVGLLPAAILGIDVVKLLQGAAAMNDRFRTSTVEEDPTLQFVGVGQALEARRGINIRVLSVWSKALESVGLWYDQLLAESIGKDFIGATPFTALNTRDLHSRAQQHQEGTRDKLMTNVIVETLARKPIAVGTSEYNQDGLNSLADKTLPEIMQAALKGTNQSYNGAGRPTADIILPAVDEASLGQLFQMTMIATVIEGRVMGVNPFGQPGVEGYKTNMNAILRS